MANNLTKPFNPMELISFVRRIFSAQDGKDPDGGPERYTIA
jgi:hypothetical protein